MRLTAERDHRRACRKAVRALSLAALCSSSVSTALAKEPPRTEKTKEGRSERAKAARHERVPAGFIEMFVAGVLTTEGGPAVILRDASEKNLLPIWIGFSEAHAIQLRLERQRFPRPLTHDLLDTVMRELGGELVKIHVDDLEGTTFVGTIFVKKGSQVTPIDARPSDSIALALGAKVPIYVSKSVLERVDRDRKKDDGSKEGDKPFEVPSEGIKTL